MNIVDVPSIIKVNSKSYHQTSKKDQFVIIDFHDKTIPVQISFVDYGSEPENGAMDVFSKAYCYDLNTGNQINYDEISQVEYMD